MKKTFVLLLSFACFCFSACYRSPQKTLLDQIKAKGEIVIATEGVWEPWNFHNSKNELVGYDIEIAKEMCARMGLRPKFLEVEWERLLIALENHECDIVVNGVAVTPERQERFYYSTPYAFERTVLIVRDDNKQIQTFADLTGKTVANSEGSTYGNLAKEYNAILIVVDTFEETVNLLLQNRADATLNSFFAFSNFKKNNPNVDIKIADRSKNALQVAIPCRRGPENLTLLLEMNKALESMRADGTMQSLSIKYFDQDITK